MKKIIFTIASACIIAAVGATEFRIEAEGVSEKADWANSVGKELIGGRQIWSNSKKGAENTAKGSYAVPEAGKYYIWVRTHNQGEKYRKTEVKVNGKTVGKFGDEGTKGQKVMAWKRTLAAFDIPAGEMKLELIPLSGYSRIDSIIFTTDKDFTPVDKDRDTIEEIAELECE